MSQEQEVKCPYGDYYAVLKVNNQGEAYTFLKDGKAKKDPRTGRLKTSMPSLEAIMRRHDKNEWKMIADWYWTTRNKLQDNFTQNRGVQHADGTPTVQLPVASPEPTGPYSALKALLGNVSDPTDIQALLAAASAAQNVQAAHVPAPAPAVVPAPVVAEVPQVQAAPPSVMSAVIDSWATALKQAEAVGKSVPVTWNFNGRPINAYLRGIQGNRVYLTMHHMAKWKDAQGELTQAVIPTTVTDIQAR